MGLQEKIDQYIDTIDATFGIHIKHMETNEQVHVQSDRLFQMASVVKVPILAKLFELVEKGEVDLADRVTIGEDDIVGGSGVFKAMDLGIQPTIKDLATMMIIVSDNLATDAIIEITSVEKVESYMRDMGIDDIHVKHTIWELLCLCVGYEPKPYTEEFYAQVEERLMSGQIDKESIVYTDSTENNVSSAQAMNDLIEKIVRGELVSQQASKGMLDIMRQQQYKQRIGGDLPREASVANKTGSLGTICNDAGVVFLPEDKGAYLITVFSDGETLDYKGNEAIATISRIAYDHFIQQ